MTTSEQTTVSTVPSGGVRVVSWGAIFSGVLIAAVVYLALLALGTGLGFIIAPWNFQEYASGTIGMAALLWITLTQLISSGGGGYIAGRLTPDEGSIGDQKIQGTGFFYAAHGLVMWALSSIAIAFLLGTAASSILSGASWVVGSGAGAGIGAGAAYITRAISAADRNKDEIGEMSSSSSGSSLVSEDGILNYALDALFRPQLSPNTGSEGQRASTGNMRDSNGSMQPSNAQRKEIARIFISSIQKNEMSEADKKYVAQLVAQRTGMSQADALNSVDAALEQIHTTLNKTKEQVKEALDSARKAAVVAALWSFATLLCGALIAAGAACYGGSWNRRRVGSQRQTRVDDRT